jgi:peptidoglycan/xylan/chitin deacetylase (PgdA/CDA1 family)
MKPKIVITVDVERDYPNGLHGSYLGITHGLPRLLEVFEEFGLGADFFVSREIVESFRGMVKDLATKGHSLGSHGTGHDYLCRMDYEAQLVDISKSTKALREVLSSRPIMFRAPQFGADGNTILALENLGYRLDSSVLPGRLVRKRLFGNILDFTDAPREAYRPSTGDITSRGGSSIIEVPLVENPFRKGTPIGMGYLNSAGYKTTIEACRAHNGSYITFLIHPWECVDILGSYPHLPRHLVSECSSDMSNLRSMLQELSVVGEFTGLINMADEFGGVDHK